jgi:hypothetical protein
MYKVKILYIGDDNQYSTSYHRAQALKRIGCEVFIKNPKLSTVKLTNSILSKIHYRTGYYFIQKDILKWLKKHTEGNSYDIIWINSGEYLGKKAINYLKSTLFSPIILYNNDDPTGGRDGRRFDTLIKAIPKYDMCVVMRSINISEYYKLGAKKVIKTFMSYDEVAHSPVSKGEISDTLKSEVSFIGTWMKGEKRDVFLLKLASAGIPISIWGNRWDKSPYWEELKPYFKGGNLHGKEYVKAIQGSKICLGLLSKGNRDQHTTRSIEIPYIGSLLCAERTKEHMDMYEEGKEAIFWKDAEECISLCKKLLLNPKLINEISKAGYKRVRSNQMGNENSVKFILNHIMNYD